MVVKGQPLTSNPHATSLSTEKSRMDQASNWPRLKQRAADSESMMCAGGIRIQVAVRIETQSLPLSKVEEVAAFSPNIAMAAIQVRRTPKRKEGIKVLRVVVELHWTSKRAH